MDYKPFPFHNLLDWYEKNGRHTLPWRQYFHLSIRELTYHVWLSEILLQQTQASRVIPFYENILKKYPTIESLAHATYEEFFPYYQWLGYYSRARNLLKAAKIVAADFAGVFPNDREKLASLPGVGPYTAAAICSFAYDMPCLAFDTNIRKVFARYYFWDKKASLPKDLLEALENQMQREDYSGRVVNAAIMDLSATTMTFEWAIDYPLVGCKWYETAGKLESVSAEKGEKFPTKTANIIVILHENHSTYLSARKGNYTPFILPPCGEKNLRHFIQEYFTAHHALTVSVRPAHDRFIKKSIAYVVCNAQIQQGTNTFAHFWKWAVNAFWKEFLLK